MKNRTNSFFSAIPRELIMQNIGGINAENALQATFEADYRALVKIIDINPTLMFIETSVCIDGVNILSSPLKYALEKLDTLAWKYFESVCVRYPQYQEQFIATVCSVEDIPDMNPLYQAYEHFIRLGQKYNDVHFFDHNLLGPEHMVDGTELEVLKKNWLALGLQQRFCLPRHLLKDMCYCTPHDLIYNDVLLMRVEQLNQADRSAFEVAINKFELKLSRIMRENDGCPMILFNGAAYQEVYLGIDDQIIWDGVREKFGHITPLFTKQTLPFIKLEFPENTWAPVRKAAEQNFDNIVTDEYGRLSGYKPFIWGIKKTLSYPLNYQTLYLKVVFNAPDKLKQLLPFTEKSGLGYDFALARGFCDMCLALEDPRGRSCFLFAKAKEDYVGIRHLIELRIEERTELVNKYANNIVSRQNFIT